MNNRETHPLKVLHVSNGWEENNGAAVIAGHIAKEQAKNGAIVKLSRFPSLSEIRDSDEVWVHCGWMPCLWRAVLLARMLKVKVVKWVPEACYDPVRLSFHGWKKFLVGPIERFCLRRATALVATCPAEADWIKHYLKGDCPHVEINDPKRFFNLDAPKAKPAKRENGCSVHLLYLGRAHPLKGVEILEKVVAKIGCHVKLKCVSNAYGEEKEKVWEWCDVLVLPTLSDNFALVVAEALERGKRVLVTDGAPAWENDLRVTYVRGYRDGSNDRREELLAKAVENEIKRFREDWES